MTPVALADISRRLFAFDFEPVPDRACAECGGPVREETTYVFRGAVPVLVCMDHGYAHAGHKQAPCGCGAAA